MNHQIKNWLCIGLVSLMLAIILGAFGAHMLEEKMTDTGTYQTASFYHFISAIVLLLYAILQDRYEAINLRWSFLLMGLGSVFFSGSVYLLAFRDDVPDTVVSIIGPITPVGGTLMIVSLALGIIQIMKSSHK